MENTFVALLKKLNVKFTKKYTNEFYESHPNKENMLGLSQMLDVYKIDNEGGLIENIDTFDIKSLTTPFVAHLSTGFAVVYNVGDKIKCILNGNKIEMAQSTFKTSWSGNVLLAKVNNSSIEPDYLEHKKEESIALIKNNIAIVLLLFIAFSTLQTKDTIDHFTSALIAGNILGFLSCILLMDKQLNNRSVIAEKICNIISTSGCNDVLNSKASLSIAGISWSEVGLGYFISNLIIIFYLPRLIDFIVIINILSLPFTFWSVWYQGVRMKKWCALCLIAQLAIWIIFFIFLIYGKIMNINLSYSLPDIILVASLYILPMLILNSFSRRRSIYKQSDQWRHAFHRLRNHKGVFETILTNQPCYNVSEDDSKIIFGNRLAKLRITIFSNPHCKPCADMHKRVHMLLDKYSDSLCIQYIFYPFNTQHEESIKFLINEYLHNHKGALDLYDRWYDNIIYNNHSMIDDLLSNNYSKNVDQEYVHHINWGKANSIHGTPTILINGYELPAIYSIEDVVYISNN